MSSRTPLKTTLIVTLIVFISVLFFIDPIPQDQSYHQFADDHTYFNIPNFWNVSSNVLFVVFGFGFFRVKGKKTDRFFRSVLILMGVGFIGTGLGSAFYHWNPNNATLVWDRIPMTVVFVSFFMLLLHRYISELAAKINLYPAICIGVLSVLYWDYTEKLGVGDLRPYIFVQFFPLVGTLQIIVFERKNNTGSKFLVMAFVCYMLAKVFELKLDQLGLDAIGFSGHSAKHVAASFSALFLLKWVKALVNTEK